MKRSSFITWEQLRVTAVIAIAALVIGVAMFGLGKAANLFSKRYELVAFVADANGLRPGGPVTVAGKLAGGITSIEFLPVDADTTRNLKLVLSVDARLRDQVRLDSRVKIKTLGLLGDKEVDITPGTPGHAMLASGDTLIVSPSLDYEAVLNKAAGAVDDVVALAADLSRITSGIVKGQGTIGQLLTNRSMYDELTGTLSRTNDLLVRVQSSKGSMAKFLDDPVLYDRMVASVNSVDSLVLSFSNKNGTLGKLVNDTLMYSNLTVLENRMISIAGGADSLMHKLASGQGTAGKLLTDQQLYDSLNKLVTDMSGMIADMRKDPQKYLRGIITLKPF